MNREEAIKAVKLLRLLKEVKQTNSILSKVFGDIESPGALLEHSIINELGEKVLYGSFNLGGTKSGRLSSSGPNMQNFPGLPEILACFKPPKGWWLVGADFSSLEDKVSALTTKDPNKMKVYTDGFDAHSLNTFHYFREQLPDIIDTKASINSIKDHLIYDKLRTDSKPITFALTYKGTWHTLVNKAGIPKAIAKKTEARNHEMYKVAIAWVNDRISEASKVGYVTGAFGLRLRTPVLAQTILHTKTTPARAKKEERTAGNMLGQSYGMLNNRAAIDLQNRLFNSPYIYDIKPVAHIHDAQYFLVKQDIGALHWLNENLIECMEWQDLPELKHPTIKLGGDLMIYAPDWSHHTKVPNRASIDEIKTIINNLK